MVWPVPFEVAQADQAMAWFMARSAMTREEFDAVRDDAKRRAFWLRRVTEASLVEDVYRSLSVAVAEGMSVADWRREIGPRVEAAWSDAGAARPEVILRNWTANAYAQERRASLLDPAVVANRPYWLFDGVADSRQSSICKACDGVVARADDPWWQAHSPPLHHQCRSGIISLDADDLADLDEDTKRPPAVTPPAGWGNPDQPWDPARNPAPEL